MTEEQQAQTTQKKGKSSGGIVKLVVLLVVVVGFGVGGFLTYRMVVAPMLQPPEGEEHATHEEETEETEEGEENTIPEGTKSFDFEETRSDVAPEEGRDRSALLMYKVSFICANEETLLLVEENKSWFISMLADVHRGRTKTELMDPRVKASIEDQALQEANALLKRLQEEPKKEIRIIKVLHLNFSVYDL